MGQLVFNDKARVGAWVASRVDQQSDWGASFYAMGAEREGELVSGIVMSDYNGSNALVHIAVDKSGKDLIALFQAFARYAFLQLQLNRLTGLVPSNRPDVLKFDLKIGFEQEFLMPKAARGGHDMHILVMWHDKCPWLKGL